MDKKEISLQLTSHLLIFQNFIDSFQAPIPRLCSYVHTPHETHLRSLLTRLQRLDALRVSTRRSRTRSASKRAYRINFKTPIY